MSIELTGEAAFDNVMERLLEERDRANRLNREIADLRQLAEERRIELVRTGGAQSRAETDLKNLRENYERLKKIVPPKELEKHERSTGDIPF